MILSIFILSTLEENLINQATDNLGIRNWLISHFSFFYSLDIGHVTFYTDGSLAENPLTQEKIMGCDWMSVERNKQLHIARGQPTTFPR